MIDRRRLLLAWGASVLATPLTCLAQQQRPRVARVGLLESASSYPQWREALVAGLRELGYVEGRNVIIEHRGADGKYERLGGLATELVRMKVDLIVAVSGQAIGAAKQATSVVPIVMVATADPVGTGFVTSLARPGGNITGLSTINIDLSGKYLEFLRAALPKLSRVSVLVNEESKNVERLKRIDEAGRANGVRVSTIQAGSAGAIDAAFETMKADRPGALIVLPDPFLRSRAPRIAELAARHRLPSLSGFREYAEFGGLLSYGQNIAEHYHRAATYIDKILRGAKAGDLPVEQPTKIELVINLKTAKAMGLTIPQELLLRADKVIE